MSLRLTKRFGQELSAGRKLFVPYLTAGDHGLEFTRKAVLALSSMGVDAVELGIPFSDPLADGKVIQTASQRALERGTALKDVLELVKQLRQETNIPLLFMGYFNPFYQMGLKTVAQKAYQAGLDGFIVPDLPPEEAYAWIQALRQVNLDTVFLATPTSTPERLKTIARVSTGYVYYVSVTGITGMRHHLPIDLRDGVKKIRTFSKLPVLVGFGISTPEQAQTVAQVADGVIVGSALVRQLEGKISDKEALQRFSKLSYQLLKTIKNK